MTGRYLVRNPLLVSALWIADAALELVSSRGPEIPPVPQSILVSNWAHLGDVIATLPALQWLRSRYPEARIGVVVGEGGLAAVEDSPLVDAIYVVDHWALTRSAASLPGRLAAYRRTRRAALTSICADGGYEVAIDLYPYFPSAAGLLKSSGAPVRIGYDSGGFGPLHTHRLSWAYDGRHMSDHHTDPVRVLAPDAPARFDGCRLAMAGAEPAIQLKDYVVLHAGAGSPMREWPVERWVDLARALSPRHRIVLSGVGEREMRCAKAVIQAVPACLNLVDKLSWNDFARLLAGAKLLVGLDSSASHLAAGFGVPVVAITSGRNAPGLWTPRTERAAVVTYPTLCAPCFRSNGCESMACVREASVADVLSAMRKVGVEP